MLADPGGGADVTMQITYGGGGGYISIGGRLFANANQAYYPNRLDFGLFRQADGSLKGMCFVVAPGSEVGREYMTVSALNDGSGLWEVVISSGGGVGFDTDWFLLPGARVTDEGMGNVEVFATSNGWGPSGTTYPSSPPRPEHITGVTVWGKLGTGGPTTVAATGPSTGPGTAPAGDGIGHIMATMPAVDARLSGWWDQITSGMPTEPTEEQTKAAFGVAPEGGYYGTGSVLPDGAGMMTVFLSGVGEGLWKVKSWWNDAGLRDAADWVLKMCTFMVCASFMWKGMGRMFMKGS